MADSGDDNSSSDEVLTWQQRKGLKQSGAPFILEEAEVGEITDDDDQEEELDSEMEKDFIDDDDFIDNGNHEMYMKQPLAARVINQRPTPLQKFLETIEYFNEDEIEKRFYNDSDEDNIDDEDDSSDKEPTNKDPKLWIVKCPKGQEKETVRQLMLKFLDQDSDEEPLHIKSVVSHENSRGYIYIEAFKEMDVKKAIDGIASLRSASYKQLETVPVKKMSQVLRVIKKADDLTKAKPFSWVRLNRKPVKFKGDICQVIYNAVKEKKLLLKLIPRVDHITPRCTEKSTTGKTTRHEERKKLNLGELVAIGKVVKFGEEKFVRFERKWYSREGFLYQTFPYDAVEGVVIPSLAEEMEFEDGDDEDLHLAFEVTSGLPGKFIYDGVDAGKETIGVMPEQEKPTVPMASVRKASPNKPSASNPFTSPLTGKSTMAPFDRKAPSTSHQSRGGGRSDRRRGGSTNRESLISKSVIVTSGSYKSRVGTVARDTGSTVYVDFPSSFQPIQFDRSHVMVLEPAANPASSHTDVHSASSQSGGTSHPIVSTSSPGRPFGNLDRNPKSRSSLIPSASSPLGSPTPIASETTGRQHEGSGSSYVEGVGSRTALTLGSPTTHSGHGSRSLSQPGRAWYHTTTRD